MEKEMKQKLDNLGIVVHETGGKVNVRLKGNACISVDADNFEDAFTAFKQKVQDLVDYKREARLEGNELLYN